MSAPDGGPLLDPAERAREAGERRLRLREARAGAEAADDRARRARERVARLDAELAVLERGFDPQDRRQADRRRTLVRRRARTAAAAERLNAARERARGLALEALTGFAAFTDPREAVGGMSDRIPFLLFPLRVETRFGAAAADGRARRELWVRVYPDDCSIDTFEATLTAGEVESARTYWTAWWQAGGVEAGRRAAWRALVASHGSGRAAWVAETYRPLNPDREPVKALETDVVLVVPTEAPPPDPEAALLADYWRAFWLADGDRAAEEAALRALADEVGEPRAAELVAGWRPANLDELPQPPRTRAQVAVSVAFVVFPAVPADTRRQAWSRAPKVAAFPDRLVLLAYAGGGAPLVVLGAPIPTPLAAGPDPYAPPAERFTEAGGDLVVPEDMRWMVDFERAVQVGMGFRIPLDDAQAAAGFDRLLVLGVRASADEEEARAELEALLLAHHRGRSGLELVSQGTPTNNTEAAGAGFTRSDDADASFDDVHAPGPLFQPSADWLEKQDGEWLAEWLGIDPAVLARVRHAGGRDQAEARAMNAALWPATLGYWMEAMLEPVFSEQAVEDTRDFFTRWVSGRGAVPAVRIGRQPYGILPTTAFSRIGWFASDLPIAGRGRLDPVRGTVKSDAETLSFLRILYGVLRAMDADWAKLAAEVSYAGRPGRDAHQTLLDVVGLHSGSVEYAQRYAESLEELFNRLGLSGLGHLLTSIVVGGLVQSGRDLLARLGWTGTEDPDLLHKFFFGKHHELKGPLVDDRPLSETEPVRAYTPAGQNYLEWLIDAAGTSLEALRRQEGFNDGRPPRALLYLLLRHALQTGYYDASLRLHLLAGALPPAEARLARRESPFLHVAPQAARSESRYHYLYRDEPLVTGQPQLSVAEFIAPRISTLPGARYLWEQLRALETLKGAPTARLERVLAEHVDLCTYRLDAWMLGLVHWQLGRMRDLREGGGGTPRRGVHLGAYAWLENVRPESRELTPVRLSADQAAVFQRPGEAPLLRDSANQGFIHAPSLNQAVTAAVLRNGYLSGAGPLNRQQLAVNLTSERVRAALGVLEGIREGQSLGALLGYQLERGLHDRHGLAEVDRFIYDLRQAFPLRANRLRRTRAPGEPITALEARNVVDGLRLAEHARNPANRTYPFGVDLPGDATAAERRALEAEVERLLETHDAVADLALAEGVFQAVQGNYDRVASTLDAYARGDFPPEPEVVRTPASGTALILRVGLHLEAGAGSADADSPVARRADPTQRVPMTPRAQAEPALNRWLAGVLPHFEDVACRVVFRRAADNAPATAQVTLFDLTLQPLDVLHLLRDESRQAMSELDDRVVQHTLATHAVRPDGGVEVRCLETDGAPLSFFQLMPLVRALRRLALASRPLQASDLALANEATAGHDEAVFADPARVLLVRGAMQAARDDLEALRVDLHGPLSDLPARRGDVLATVDAWVQQVSARLLAAARAGLPEAGAGFVHDWHARQFGAVLARVAARVFRWDGRLSDFDARMAAYDLLPAGTPDEERFSLLQQAERLVAPGVTDPRPATPAAYRLLLDGRRTTFLGRRNALAGVLLTTRTAVGPLMDDVRALLPVSDVDPLELTLVPEEDEVVRFAQDALRAVQAAVAELDRRLAASQARLDEHAAASTAPARVAALTAAAKALLGDDFVLVPEFGLRPAQGDELEQAVGASASLFDHLDGSVPGIPAVDFPVDEWLYGAARVRDKLRAWEEVVMVAGGFGRPEPGLTPLQLPFRAGDRWLGLQFQPGYDLDGDRLLYTAHFSAPFQKAGRQCGLLLDEWTEVIPGEEADTGLAFHYDRPNSEPPQTMLLVTPTAFRGGWQWSDLVDALNETLEMAKKRAVEPAQVDATPYARLLPATLMAVTVSQLSITANLALNNDVQALLTTS